MLRRVGRVYFVLARDVETAIEVKRSRFVCTLRRVETESRAREVVEGLRKLHWDAGHHCSAFVLGPPPMPAERSSDDGEPAGTAGAPMLEVLRGSGVSDVVAVVSRWFGGTLLGTGGLVRAYGDAVRSGLELAGTTRRELLHEHVVELDHADAGRVEGDLRSRGFAVLDTSYGATGVTLRLGGPADDREELDSALAALTGGRVEARLDGERWVDL